MNFEELKDFLDEKADFYNNSDFIAEDPLQIPHRFSKKQDVEIAAFLTATISWGNRKSIINSATKMMQLMDDSPHDFILNHSAKELESISQNTIHRTFKGEDFSQFIINLKKIYSKSESLENSFKLVKGETNFKHGIERFRSQFLGDTLHRSSKHISSPHKNSSAKRLIMFLRWMIREDGRNVDFGLWKSLPKQFLSIPLDVHTGNISRKLNLISRTQNDWKAVEELDVILRKMDAKDPSKYDFALFGLGVSGDFDKV
ncbi:TIGR02757 family protein [Frigoriflavimonas asaccharolytica]|uniref:Uncharacterized protein (TIGR02757 family) n=1 Tax=Frigoriflavimonas asaccharolytica TaxID=2735899 RepID=A0A8J8G9I1_9FLAO|nr:TIGR02757 family protein [Frigoriflavimonas asaccharolytica]NRS91447.1 uncharacterized protein (TIGR02757 family) [Frigoriflavimonas asaccharolytica]